MGTFVLQPAARPAAGRGDVQCRKLPIAEYQVWRVWYQLAPMAVSFLICGINDPLVYFISIILTHQIYKADVGQWDQSASLRNNADRSHYVGPFITYIQHCHTHSHTVHAPDMGRAAETQQRSSRVLFGDRFYPNGG